MMSLWELMVMWINGMMFPGIHMDRAVLHFVLHGCLCFYFNIRLMFSFSYAVPDTKVWTKLVRWQPRDI